MALRAAGVRVIRRSLAGYGPNGPPAGSKPVPLRLSKWWGAHKYVDGEITEHLAWSEQKVFEPFVKGAWYKAKKKITSNAFTVGPGLLYFVGIIAGTKYAHKKIQESHWH